MVKIYLLFKNMVFINLLASEIWKELILSEEINLVFISFI